VIDALAMKLPYIYVSTDIETDGQVPGVNSMLSIGSAAFFEDKTLIDTFTANLESLSEARADEKTMRWWQTQPEAWRICRENTQPPDKVMKEYCRWLEQLPGHIIFVGYPLVFDFRFIDYYLHRFVGKNPFGFAGIDIRSFVMGMRKAEYRQAGMNYLPKRWFDNLKHTHIALEDAIEQGVVFCNMLIEQKSENLRKLKEKK
jgi:DNA polymerase III alpha subunit (gram-positive type)